MPMTQRSAWRNIQKRDSVHNKLSHLISTQQLPETKKTKGDYTKLKLLHNQYTQGKLFIDNDGLIMLKSPEGKLNGVVISVPPSLFPGIANALHLQLEHPSKSQLSGLIAPTSTRLVGRPSWKRSVTIVINVPLCVNYQKISYKILPKFPQA